MLVDKRWVSVMTLPSIASRVTRRSGPRVLAGKQDGGGEQIFATASCASFCRGALWIYSSWLKGELAGEEVGLPGQ